MRRFFLPDQPARWTSLLASVFLMSGIAVTDAAQVDYFLKIPDIDGEATDEGHKDWINLLSVSSGMTKPSGAAPVSGEFVLSKEIDKSSPKLMEACATGIVLPSAEMELLKVDDRVMRFYRIEMKNVLVTSYQSSLSGPDGDVEETVSFAPQEITWTYTEYDVSGRPTGDILFHWDIVKNEMLLRETFVVRATGRTVPGSLDLSWKAAPGKVFQVLSNSSIDGEFQSVDGNIVIVDENGDANVALPIELGNRFFRFEEIVPQ